MTTILMATDFSESANRILDRVAELAQKLDAKLVLLHVVVDLTVLASGTAAAAAPVDPHELEQTALANLEALRENLPQDLEVETRTAFTRNDVASEIAAKAEELDVDLVAMATHGRSGLTRMLMGSVAESTLRRSTTPLLLFPVQ